LNRRGLYLELTPAIATANPRITELVQRIRELKLIRFAERC